MMFRSLIASFIFFCLIAASSSQASVVRFSPGVTASQIIAAVADNSIDVIELTSGTYRISRINISTNRTVPVVIRPAPGASVVFAGGTSSGGFSFRDGASYITVSGITFDGYTLDSTGIIWAGNAHDITLNDITVQNSTAKGVPYKSWALYLSMDNNIGVSNITARNWRIIGKNRSMSGVMGGKPPASSNVILTNFTVSDIAYAGYFTGNIGVTVDGWRVDDSGYHASSTSNYAMYFSSGVTDVYKNICATNSAKLGDFAPIVNGGNVVWNPPAGC